MICPRCADYYCTCNSKEDELATRISKVHKDMISLFTTCEQEGVPKETLLKLSGLIGDVYGIWSDFKR